MVRSVLFVCNMNSVRSPMAAAILAEKSKGAMTVDSAGVYEGGPDPFIPKVLAEIGVELGEYEPKALDEIETSQFDRLIALTPEALHELRRQSPHYRVEFWPIDNPTDVRGGRDALLEAYRAVRDDLSRRIGEQFPEIPQKP